MSDEVKISQWQLEQYKDKERLAEKPNSVQSAMRQLLEVLKSSIVVLWWAVGMGGSLALWFLPLPQGRIPTILFICTSVIYALLSPAIYKVKEIEGKAD